MKLKFKHQPFQAEAAAAVCDVFNDQPLRTANYRIDLGDTTNMQQRMDFSEVGFRNHPLVPAEGVGRTTMLKRRFRAADISLPPLSRVLAVAIMEKPFFAGSS